MNYKEAFNEWASEFMDANNREPTLIESNVFEEEWTDGQYDLADCHRHGG